MFAHQLAHFERRATVARALCLIWITGTLLTLPAGSGHAAGRHAALVVDANSGRIISESAADEPRYPASLTKMMTIYIVFDLIEQGRLSYDKRITFSETATRVPPTKLGTEVGGSITVIEAIKALITKSANDASVALAEHIAGSEARFSNMMTETARRIGMKATTFRNAHGLPHPEQVTTARDMIMLGLRLQDDFPMHYPLFGIPAFTYRGETHRNHNTLLTSYEGTDGIKTGYIGSSGFNLVANVKRGNKHIIGVVFGGASASARNLTMRTLLNIALFKASTVRTRQTMPLARARTVPSPVAATRPATAAPPLAPPPGSALPLVTADAMPARPIPAGAAISAASSAPSPTIRQASRPARPQGSTEPVLSPEPQPAAEPLIQIAQVRALLVTPRQPSPEAPMPRPALPPEQSSQTATAFQPPRIPPVATSVRGTAPATLPARSQTPGRTPAQLTAPPPEPRRPGPAATASAPAPIYRLAGPPSSPAGILQIQVGAYVTKADAERQLATVRQQTGPLLAPYASHTIEAASNGKPIHRARYSGFDAAAAGAVCNELRRRQIDCMVAKAE